MLVMQQNLLLFIINNLKSVNLYQLFYPLYPIEHNGYSWGKRLTLLSRIIIGIREIIFGKKIRFKFIIITNLIKHLIFFFYCILLFPIVIIFYFIGTRFIHISTWQIGAYIHQLDTIVKQNKLGKNFKLILLCPNFICANNFVSDLYSKELICIKNYFAYIILLPFIHNKLISIDPWPFETQNKKSIFNKIHSNYSKKFKEEVLKLEIKKIKKNFKNENYDKTICIHVRDNFYNNSSRDRNVKIETYKKTINFLLKKKFKIIRFINLKSKRLNFKNKNYSEYLIATESDKINQFLIINSCRLVIGTQSGVLNYNLISKTPFLLTNAIPINNIMVIKKKDMYIFKKFKKNKKLLSITEIKNNKYHTNPEKIKNKIKIIDNTEDEILNATKEILNLKKFKTRIKLKKKYKLLLKNTGAIYSDAKISNYFLSKNRIII
jgi:putative glycosyltransferase (TIGR04372 family)